MTTSTTTHTNGYRYVVAETFELDPSLAIWETDWNNALTEGRSEFEKPLNDIFRHHKKLPNGKNSMADYDLALAKYAIATWSFWSGNRWKDQQIAHLIILHRKLVGIESDLEKAVDVEYVTDIIKKARNRDREPTAEDFDDTPAYYIFESLGLNIERLVKIVEDDGRGKYHIATSDGETVFVGGAGVVMSENRFRVAVADAIGIVMKPQPRGVWPSIAQKLFDVTEDVAARRSRTS